jgi:hypothetical protein
MHRKSGFTYLGSLVTWTTIKISYNSSTVAVTVILASYLRY